MNQKYDLIGDIHGYATTLHALLAKLGYRERDGAYRHPERQVIFLGDFIDRGPEIRATLQTVRAMVDGGSALAIMGNHEFNAMAYATPDGKGGYLRPHTPSKVAQHRGTVEQICAPHPGEWRVWLDWFATLPLFLDLGEIRAVHATWDAEAVETFRAVERIDETMLRAMADTKSPLGRARSHLLNGLEIRLPEGRSYPDLAGIQRNEIRTRWWEPLAGKTYRQAVFPDSDSVPELAIPGAIAKLDLTYRIDQPPVFFGHYWMPSELTRMPLAPNVAVLDYSVARGGCLTAYRWDGETVLLPEKYVTVENQSWPPADRASAVTSF